MNLIARAKLGSHLRPRSVQFFNILGIIKNKLWDHRIVWWFCSQIFFAHFGASFASSSASATPKGDPGLRSGLRSLRSYIRYENLSKNHQKSWISQLFLRSPMLKNWRTGSPIWSIAHEWSLIWRWLFTFKLCPNHFLWVPDQKWNLFRGMYLTSHQGSFETEDASHWYKSLSSNFVHFTLKILDYLNPQIVPRSWLQ